MTRTTDAAVVRAAASLQATFPPRHWTIDMPAGATAAAEAVASHRATLHLIPNAQSSSSPASLLSVSLQGATERPVNVAVDYWPELTRPHRSQSGACTVALRLQRSLRCAKRQITVDGIKVCLCHHRSLSRLDQSYRNRDRVARQTHARVGLEIGLVTPV